MTTNYFGSLDKDGIKSMPECVEDENVKFQVEVAGSKEIRHRIEEALETFINAATKILNDSADRNN